MEQRLCEDSLEVSQTGQILVAASQVESQTDQAKSLPALQQGDDGSGDYSDSEVVYPVMDPAAEKPGSFILAADSEVEGREKPAVSDDAHVIEESVSEDNMDQGRATSSSDETANITVIARDIDAPKQQEDPMSSQDLFQAKDEEEDVGPVSTPSCHVPTLQFSGQPILVPETLDESLDDQGTPDAYGDMPIIIPSTPSLTVGDDGAEGEYNPGEMQTLCSQPVLECFPMDGFLQCPSDIKRFQLYTLLSQHLGETVHTERSESSSQKNITSSSNLAGEGDNSGPTMASDVIGWEQSQSLCLQLTTSSSSSQIQAGQLSQVKGASVSPSLDPGNTGSQTSPREPGVSQSLRLRLGESQNSSQQLSGSFSLSVPKTRSGSLLPSGSGSMPKVGEESGLHPRTGSVGKTVVDPVSSSSSRERSSDSAVIKSSKCATKPAVSVAMVHSESQSASETIFDLEKPDVGETERKSQAEEGGASQNIFLRTRSKKSTLLAPTHASLVESEDFFLDIRKPGKPVEAEQSLSDSDPIPCSQNQPRRRSSRPLTLESMEEEEPELPAEENDVYNVDTVMDSEPEDEGTQSYEVFPALSRNSSSVSMATSEQMHVDELPVPALLPATVTVSSQQHVGQMGEMVPSSPASQQRQSSLQVNPDQPRSHHATRLSQRASQRSEQSLGLSSQQPVVQGVGLQIEQEVTKVGQKKKGSQDIQSVEGVSQSVQGASKMIDNGHLQQSVVQSEHSQPSKAQASQDQSDIHLGTGDNIIPGSQTRSRSRAEHGRSQASVSPAKGASQPAAVVSGSQGQSVQRTLSQRKHSQLSQNPGEEERSTGKSLDNPGTAHRLASPPPAEEHSVAEMSRKTSEVKAVEPAVSLSHPSVVFPELDPFVFHSSQSQRVDVEGATTSRAETSVSTLHAGSQFKSKSKGYFGRRRKMMIKKKEVYPRGETEVKSSSTDDSTAARFADRPAKKPRRGNKFTRLQKTSEFKRPGVPTQRSSRGKDGNEEGVDISDQSRPQSAVQHQPSYSTLPAGQKPVLQPVPSTSTVGMDLALSGSSQDSQKLRARKSVEFSSSVQIGSPTLPFIMEHSLSDSQSSDTLLEVTHITDYVMRFVKRRTVIKQINNDGQVVHEQVSEEDFKPELMQEIEHTNKRRVFPMSPSRSVCTLTSGDLADISSSSLSNKASSGPSSLERAGSSLELSHPPPLSSVDSVGEVAGSSGGSTLQRNQTGPPWRLSRTVSAPATLLEQGNPPSAERSVPQRSSAGPSPAVSFLTPNQSVIERDDSRLDAVVTSSSSGRGSESLFSADNLATNEVVLAQQAPPAAQSSSTLGSVPPSSADDKQQKQLLANTPRSSRKSTRRAAADSSQEENKSASKVTTLLESQTFLPGTESGGFSVGQSGTRRKSPGGFSGSEASGSNSAKMDSGSIPAAQKPKAPTKSESVTQSTGTEITAVSVTTVSKLEIGAHVMCRWIDGFFYPATFIGLNTAIGNKFKVVFEDGMEKTVRAIDLVMAQNLPVGQSVLVMGDSGVYDPGIIVSHVINDEKTKETGKVSYNVAMDDGSVKRCQRSCLLLSEDQASLLLSDEEYRASFGETDPSHVNTADLSLDNVIQGKRLRIKGSPAVGVPRISQAGTSSAGLDSVGGDRSDSKRRDLSPTKLARASRSHDVQETPRDSSSSQESSSRKSSSRKRKIGPVATSTPTPKQMKRSEGHLTPKRGALGGFNPFGGIVASPELQKRPLRKARIGLFENVKGPIPTQPGLFTGHTFLLTHVDKLPATVAEEKRQLQLSSDVGGDDSTDDGGDPFVVPFDKYHLRAQIEGGGGSVLNALSPSEVGVNKKLFLISDTYQRTVKYFQCLASNVTIVSHRWIINSCEQNKLLDFQSYVLPAGISLEKHQIVERSTSPSCLSGQRVLVSSSSSGYTEAWTSILEMAQCKVLSKFASGSNKSRPGVDVVVTDHTCSASIEERARTLGVPLVGSEWVIQCLINNTLMAYSGHPKYAHDYFQTLGSSSQDTE